MAQPLTLINDAPNNSRTIARRQMFFDFELNIFFMIRFFGYETFNFNALFI
jgi:hypothetical protein